MPWTLENIFYLLGIIFLVLMLIVMIASVIGIIMAIRKLKDLEQEVRAKLASTEHTTAGQMIKTALPFVMSVAMGGGLKSLLGRFRR